MKLRKGPTALQYYNEGGQVDESATSEEESDDSAAMKSGSQRMRTRRANNGSSTKRAIYLSEDEDEEIEISDNKRRRVSEPRTTRRSQRTAASKSHHASVLPESESSGDNLNLRRSTRRAQPTRGAIGNTGRFTRSSGSNRSSYKETVVESDVDNSDGSENIARRPGARLLTANTSSRGRGRGRGSRPMGARGGMTRTRGHDREESSSDERPGPTRRSGRSTKATRSMKERMEDEEMFADDAGTTRAPQVISIRETFKPLAPRSLFRTVHNKHCDVCDGKDNDSNKGPSPLIFCQGCSTSIHKVCLGYRSGREHIVTKLGDQDFVLQCRRCIGLAKRKDPTAPRLDVCQTCKNPGEACQAFSQKKTSKQEEKVREENGGDDPITPVDPGLVNNAAVVLFRCRECYRGFHFEHLPPQDDQEEEESPEGIRDSRVAEYSQTWRCKACLDAPSKVQGLVAWRPANIDTYTPGQTLDMVNEDEKEYLVKWEDLSYFRCIWMPGAWVWGVTTTPMRNGFARRDEGINALPKMNEEDAIPEEFRRMEIVLDVKYSSRVSTHTEEIDKARVNEVEEVYAKFQGLGYDDVVWERPPSPTETERWADFVAAYNEYIAGKYFKQPQAKMKERIQEYRALNFKRKVLLHEQPACLTGGKMMEYQMEGLNWLLYNYHQEKNVILADEMGLGKTIQVIAAIATLVKEKPKVSFTPRQLRSFTQKVSAGPSWSLFPTRLAPIGVERSKNGPLLYG